MIKTTLKEKINNAPTTNVCSFMRCMTCSHKECMTGQEARKHGRKAYDAVIRELDAATWPSIQ